MKKHNVEPLKESSPCISETRLSTLRPKGTKSDHDGSFDIIVNGQTIFGLQVASKVFGIICDAELGKPYMFLIGRNPARDNNDIEGSGDGNKQMAACNELHRGFTLARKGADLPKVSYCMNGGMNYKHKTFNYIER